MGIKAGMVCVWTAGKTTWSLRYTWAILRMLHGKALYKFMLVYLYLSKGSMAKQWEVGTEHTHTYAQKKHDQLALHI